jgi:hypothetical protein
MNHAAPIDRSPAPRRPVGAPSKFTPEVCQALCTHIAAALPPRDACVLAGISYSLFREWMVAGENGDARFVEFVEAIHRAEVLAKQKHLERIDVAGERDWKASGWILSHRWPEDYATQSAVRVQHSGTVLQVQVQVPTLAIAQVAGLLGLADEPIDTTAIDVPDGAHEGTAGL